MSGRHQPTNGADADYTKLPFRVQIKDTEGPAWWVTVNAMGRHDARNQAVQKAYDAGADAVGVIRIEPVESAA